MAIVYFDSSALVKLFVEEQGSDQAAELWDRCDAPVSSRLAYPEVRASIAAARRDHRLDDGDEQRAVELWEQFWDAVRVVAFTGPVSAHAGALAGTHGLRGADAVHLASAAAVAPDLIIAVWDLRLATAARRLGFSTVP